MKTVFDNYELAHVFASGTQDHGRSHNGNMFFQGETIYSYGEHFPIASRIYGKWLFNADSYSVSTAKHKSIVHGALSHVDSMSIPSLALVKRIAATRDKETKSRLAREYVSAIAKDIERIEEKLQRMRAEWKISNARSEIASLERAANFVWHTLCKRRGDPIAQATKRNKQAQRQRKIGMFKAGRTDIETVLADDPDSIITNWEKIKPEENAENFYFQNWARVVREQCNRIFRDTIGPIQIKESRKLLGVAWSDETLALQIQRDERFSDCAKYALGAEKIARGHWEKINAAKIENWLNGDSDVSPRGGVVRCRVKDDRVETSQGAKVPLRDAIRIVKFAAICRNNGTAWRRNSEKQPVGIYQTDRIDADGTLHIGCHTIPWDSVVECVKRFVPELMDVVVGSKQ